MKNQHLLLGLAFFLTLAFAPSFTYGQEKAPEETTKKSSSSFDRHLYLTAEGGLSLFNGDLNMYGFLADPQHMKFNGAFGLGYQFTPVVGAFGKFGIGSFGGEKDNLANGQVVNAMIDESKFWEGSLNLSFNMMNLFAGYNPDRMFSIATHVGYGVIDWQARAVDITSGLAFDPEIGYGTNTIEEGWTGRATAGIIPVGAEFTFKTSEKVDVYADYTLYFSDTDRLDAFVDDWSDPRHTTEGSYANDIYAHLNFGVRYKFITNSVKSMVNDFGLVKFEVIPDPLVERGDSVAVTVKGTFPPKYFKKYAAMNLTPVLTYEGGSVALNPINLKGETVTGDGTLINYANGGTFSYTQKIPYNPSMNVSDLVVAPLIYPTKSLVNTTREGVRENEKFSEVPQTKLADGVIYTSKRIADEKLPTAVAAHGYEKVTVVTQNAAIYYQVNLNDLNMNLPLNKKQENKDLLASVTKNIEMGWKVKDITIAGWASPEGEETFNSGLSDRRALTAKKYMDKELGKLLKNKNLTLSFADVKELTFNHSANGPDWNGFMNAVEASNIKDKAAILNVVRSADVSQREQEIRNMILIYPELEAEILPPLRRAMITVNAFQPKKTDEEIARLSTNDPSKLELNELLYAATLTTDMRTRKMIYASAMELHPKCFRAVVNAAETEIQMGNLSEAKNLLNKAVGMSDKSALAYDNLATIAIKERNFTEAETNLNKAKQLGADVNYKMGIVNIYKGDYSKAVSLMQATKCDYNLGLAQLLNADYNAAKATLDCAPETAKSAYLKAIIGARNNDSAALYSNLMNAIQKEEGYKSIAKGDREFVKFFNQPDFQNLVK